MNLKTLAKQFKTIKHNGTAGQQLFLAALVKECSRKEPRPVCPKCFEVMVRQRVITDGGEVMGWGCSC